MGKRRKPTRKPSYQSLDDINEMQGLASVRPDTRMAGDEIIDELRAIGADEVIGNAEQNTYLAQQLGRYAEQDRLFEEAGVPRDAIGALLDADFIDTSVPAPYIDRSNPLLERRVHTDYKRNPFTNESEIQPFIDVDTGGALVSEFGDSRDVGITGLNQGDKATEYVAERVLKLMDVSPKRGPHKGVDFTYYDNDDKRSYGVDAQIQRGPGKIDTQLYTYLRPEGKDYALSPEGGRQATQDVRKLIKEAPNSNSANLIDVIEGLAGEGAFYDKHNNRFGKALKQDYDYVIMPQYSVDFANKNQKARDTITAAPDAITLNKLSNALESLTQKSANEVLNSGEARVSWNMGNNRNGPMRGRINVNTPESALFDVTETHPLTRQLLSNL